jgi:hypothetical protein
MYDAHTAQSEGDGLPWVGHDSELLVTSSPALIVGTFSMALFEVNIKKNSIRKESFSHCLFGSQ